MASNLSVATDMMTPIERAKEAAKTLEDPEEAHKGQRLKMLGLAKIEEERERLWKKKQQDGRRARGFDADADQSIIEQEKKKKIKEDGENLEHFGSARGGVQTMRDEFKQQSIFDGTFENSQKEEQRYKENLRKGQDEVRSFEAEREAEAEKLALSRGGKCRQRQKKRRQQKRSD
ncbi:unnamed protein product [Polarella glacialis]|uniref:Uncharacterized protein n=1 Tax=Polarella glacialis TaxID=89957 RepID=A0A813JWQ2_POLGL|nr:unnamed protein product [Polarella glacialis]